MHLARYIAAVLLLTFASASVRAQTNLLSLADARNAAFQRNWDLLAAQSGIDIATAQLIVAREFPDPILSLSTAKVGTHDSATVLGNGLAERSYDTIAAVSQLIEIGGKRHDRQVAARAGITGARARFHDAKRTLDQGVTKAYIAAVLADENARVLTDSAKMMEHEAAIARAQFNAGDLSAADTKNLEVNAAQFELQAKSAVAAAVQARIAVEILMGSANPGGNWQAADTLSNLVDSVPAAPAIPAAGNAVRPDVLAAQADLQAGMAELKLQKAMRIPDPTFSVGVEHNPPDSGPAEDTLNFAISFPLPIWNQNGGNIKSAQAAVDQFAEALGKARTQAMADLAIAQSEYDEAHARWLRYRDDLAPKSAAVRDSVAFQYEKGAATLVALLNAEQTDNTIRLALAQAMNDTASAAADLLAARTVLTEADLKSKH